ncbi:6-phosphogluconate dehydrogenase (decarboxylating) [Thermosporothrix hazakensis]|jgi:6-phosphogluconate dehydrogenase|uniref:6-phosphogluconate dehydrogenase (Decarboxylating) n=3 Tax=Thermosporothrix TaxID=768650 RepID=A0A326UQY1_THEHA|nr:6-phosphogluconate dehydrogenase (decarboxylating) [Thermosporothrix hazakensis]BBH88896.1 6-phosphogluconate dehydrogenase [Thermosporothrix sp. COM3]GCE47081.1 6-phosphogluconate dehydrogenase [Thermosporothrix hazakensis]
MEIGFIGLGRMGANMVRRLLRDNHRVVAWNRTAAKTDEIVKEGAEGAYSIQELVGKLQQSPRVVWVMVPAGQATDDMIQEVLPYLNKGDIIIDGGNSNYKDSIRRGKELTEKGFHFMDAGTSGGIWGLKVGYCLMVGGEKETFEYIEPLLKTLAPPDGYLYCGSHGAGHFVKMVHNGIEYGIMQAYGEGFEILKASQYDFDLHAISHLWNQGSVVRSWLLELAESAFEQDPQLESIKGYVEDSGEGRWTIQQAIDTNVPAPVITLSLFERFHSRQDESFSAKVLAALRKGFGGHAVKSNQ